ncbi:MAG: SDR family NAD(P)-dependent oxidoreductase [Candidatus Lambdaproteobacteria bacterium]|nr:SDR family NAD(P)-dependent oxidoreductase [Candidatus Lambdaproteobacteria bacterium]
MKGLQRWRGKAALVTGAGSGIGEATARALSGAGLRVVLAARRAEPLERVRRELAEAGGEALCVPLDMAREESIKAMFAAIRQAWGGVDVVVNNAGLAWHGTVEHGDSDQWRQMAEVNFLGFSLCLREALAAVQQRPMAQIINISSLSAHRIKPGGDIAFYGASKHAMRAVVDGLRAELAAKGSHVKLGMISPGLVHTGLVHTAVPVKLGLDPEDRTRFLNPASVADAVLYMLSTPPHVQIHDIFLLPIGQP